MAGRLPAPGNKRPERYGATVSRRLRAAGWRVSPSAARHQRDGIYVRAAGDFVSVLIDLPDHAAVGERIAGEVRSWGMEPEVSNDSHEGMTWTKVRFTYRKGEPVASERSDREGPPYFVDVEGRGPVQVPEEFGRPVYHALWKEEIVGFLTPDEFHSIDVIQEILKGLPEPKKPTRQSPGEEQPKKAGKPDFEIVLPAEIMDGLHDMDSFRNNDPEEEAVLAAVQAAVYSGVGRRRKARLRGPHTILCEILDYVEGLVGFPDRSIWEEYDISDDRVWEVVEAANEYLEKQKADRVINRYSLCLTEADWGALCAVPTEMWRRARGEANRAARDRINQGLMEAKATQEAEGDALRYVLHLSKGDFARLVDAAGAKLPEIDKDRAAHITQEIAKAYEGRTTKAEEAGQDAEATEYQGDGERTGSLNGRLLTVYDGSRRLCVVEIWAGVTADEVTKLVNFPESALKSLAAAEVTLKNGQLIVPSGLVGEVRSAGRTWAGPPSRAARELRQRVAEALDIDIEAARDVIRQLKEM
ncbi:hypothetical protein C9F11_10230 [Streptomyces sp. YIM 121038]|uniref:hypothetical protein n=1 Tax=Streptomyces sp. YIM 121038 TaxID=2136401 RepID=UPI001110253C|nr:hypothetical protein [Streptomyces sp. YIM 121038]QCX75726.1 hypothetical protein C9F11_10230 [Streptomyces sp. YIM 121038]